MYSFSSCINFTSKNCLNWWKNIRLLDKILFVFFFNRRRFLVIVLSWHRWREKNRPNYIDGNHQKSSQKDSASFHYFTGSQACFFEKGWHDKILLKEGTTDFNTPYLSICCLIYSAHVGEYRQQAGINGERAF